MTKAMSKGAIDRLGVRLRESERPSREDRLQLQGVEAMYDAALQQVERGLRELGLSPTGRLKTVDTLVDKLKREPGMPLSRVQDVAGTRLVVGETRVLQDQVVQQVVENFPDSRIRDRRRSPSAGYRAVHIIVKADGLPVEVQVRTDLQHFWAELVERLADAWGRQIRYGGEPENPTQPLWTPDEGEHERSVDTRASLWTLIQGLAESIDRVEDTEDVAEELLAHHRAADYSEGVARVEEARRSQLREARQLLVKSLGLLAEVVARQRDSSEG